MEKKNQNAANAQNAAIEQNAEVKNVGAVVTLEVVNNEAKESGKDAPATIADVREAFAVDMEKFRKAFADTAKADANAENKTAVCVELFVLIKTWDELKAATRHATPSIDISMVVRAKQRQRSFSR